MENTELTDIKVRISGLIFRNFDREEGIELMGLIEKYTHVAGIIENEGYLITNHPKLPNNESPMIWVEHPSGEGTTVDLHRLFKWAM